MIPREGGNTIRGSFFGTFGNDAMQGSNFDDELRAAGLRSPNEVKEDLGGQRPGRRSDLPGPAVVRRQLQVPGHAQLDRRHVPQQERRRHHEVDLRARPDAPAFNDDTIESLALRLTYQVSAKNKFNVFWDEQWHATNWLGGGSRRRRPKASMHGHVVSLARHQHDVEHPAHQSAAARGGLSAARCCSGAGKERPGYNREMIRVTEQAGAIPGLTYRGMTWDSSNLLDRTSSAARRPT